MRALVAARPAIAAIEVASVARGIGVLDRMAKRAETTIVANRTLSPGRYLIVLSGEVAEIEEAMDAARAFADEDRVDEVILRDPAAGLRAALASEVTARLEASLAIVETATISAALLGADRALKDADVRLLEVRLGAGLSGKGIFTVTGSLDMVEAAGAAVRAQVGEGRIVRIELIAQPHPDLPARLLEAEQAAVHGPSA